VVHGQAERLQHPAALVDVGVTEPKLKPLGPRDVPGGRALGHICFGHTQIAILLGGDKSTLPELLSWIAQVRNIVFSGYRQAQVLSADRAGILAGGLRVAIETLGKLSLGNSQVREVREEDLIDQTYELSRGVNHLQAWLIILFHSATPPMFLRLRAMVEWAGLPPPPA
jgi:hypothetical protein